MPNITFKLGTLDLSSYVRVNPNEKLNLGAGDMIEPAWSDSPLFEGQTLTSIQVKNKELIVPLFLHPPTPPYQTDALNALVTQVNQQLRLTTDLGLAQNVQWNNAQASNSTFWTLQFGRFEPDFNFRITEKGWLAGVLHLWVLPYAHTATERILSTWAAPTWQSGMLLPAASMIAAGSPIAGDVSPQFDLRLTVGSYMGDDGRIGIMSSLPQASYNPIIPVGSFIGLSPSAIIFGASGAWASQFLAIDAIGTQAQVGSSTGVTGYFSFALSPASVYAGDNRILGLVRARYTPFGLRAFNSQGDALGPTVVASAMDGWQLVDYGSLRIPPWMGTAVVNVQAYAGIDYNASGMFAPRRAAPVWTKEHGPIFVVPEGNTLLSLDWNSPLVLADGFDGASGAQLGRDMLGNTWVVATNAFAGTPSPMVYDGKGALTWSASNMGVAAYTGTSIAQDWEWEALFTFPSASAIAFSHWLIPDPDIQNSVYAMVQMCASGAYFQAGLASLAIPSPMAGQYHLRFLSRQGNFTANLWGPSGAFPGSASGMPLVATSNTALQSAGGPGGTPSYGSNWHLGFAIQATNGTPSIAIQAVRARLFASQGMQSRDVLHLSQPLLQHTRMTPPPFPVDITDLQARQRGALQSIALTPPSLGAGLFVASFPWDQGPANDLLNVAARVRERFTYAR